MTIGNVSGVQSPILQMFDRQDVVASKVDSAKSPVDKLSSTDSAGASDRTFPSDIEKLVTGRDAFNQKMTTGFALHFGGIMDNLTKAMERAEGLGSEEQIGRLQSIAENIRDAMDRFAETMTEENKSFQELMVQSQTPLVSENMYNPSTKSIDISA